MQTYTKKTIIIISIFLTMLFFQNCGDLSSNSIQKNLNTEIGSNISSNQNETVEVDPVNSIKELISTNTEETVVQKELKSDENINSMVTKVAESEVVKVEPVVEVMPIEEMQNPKSRRDRLLSQTQEGTGMLSRTGWGQNATGGTRYVTVSTASELTSALKVSGNYVIISSSMAGKRMTLKNGLAVTAKNVTLDGSDAPGFEIFNPGGFLSLRVLADNVIIHSIKFTAIVGLRTTAVGILNGENIWFDHVTLSGFSKDDGIGIGDTNSKNLARKITISNLKTDKDNFGSVLINVYNPEYKAGFYGNLTVHNSHLQAAQRAMKNDGGRYIHFFNNYIDGVIYSHVDATDGNDLPSSAVISTLSESNHYDNIGGSNTCAERTKGNEFIYTNGLSIYGKNYRTCGNVLSSAQGGDTPPYDYILMDTKKIKDIVSKNAGAY